MDDDLRSFSERFAPIGSVWPRQKDIVKRHKVGSPLQDLYKILRDNRFEPVQIVSSEISNHKLDLIVLDKDNEDKLDKEIVVMLDSRPGASVSKRRRAAETMPSVSFTFVDDLHELVEPMAYTTNHLGIVYPGSESICFTGVEQFRFPSLLEYDVKSNLSPNFASQIVSGIAHVIFTGTTEPDLRVDAQLKRLLMIPSAMAWNVQADEVELEPSLAKIFNAAVDKLGVAVAQRVLIESYEGMMYWSGLDCGSYFRSQYFDRIIGSSENLEIRFPTYDVGEQDIIDL